MEIARAVARNAGARFSESGLATLVKKAKADDGLTEILGVRIDIPPHLFRQLVSRVSEVVRTRLLESAPPSLQKQIQSAIIDVVDEVHRTSAELQNYDQAQRAVEDLNRSGKLNDKAVLSFALNRQHKEITAALALMCTTTVETIESLIANSSNEGIVFACKAASLRWDTAEMILRSRSSNTIVSTKDLADARAAFQGLSLSAAQRTVRFWQVRSSAKRAN
jgi:hypothetical protein